MGFTRNLHYLRISEKIILPLYLYLDAKYLDWMSDHILQHILSDLQPRILAKLMMESEKFGQTSGGKKKEDLDTHRGETYQFCYFLRRMEPHSIVLKTRNYVARVSKPSIPPPPSTSTTHRQKRKVPVSASHSRPSRSSKKARTKTRTGDDMNVDDLAAVAVGSEGAIGNRKAKQKQNMVIDVDGDEDMVDYDDDEEYRPDIDNTNQHSNMDEDPTQDILDLTVDEEEEKPKPALQLCYKGFHVYGQCLCVVVEPWPKPEPKTKSILRVMKKFKENNKSTQPRNTITTRSTTPLFLAEEQDDLDEEGSPRLVAYQHTWDSSEEGDGDDDDEVGGMMAFSQALNSLSDVRPGAAADEDEMDGAVLLGDADEARGT